MVAVTICNAITANMTSAGCAWVTGKHMDQNITNVLDIKKILTLLMSQLMHKQEKL